MPANAPPRTPQAPWVRRLLGLLIITAVAAPVGYGAGDVPGLTFGLTAGLAWGLGTVVGVLIVQGLSRGIEAFANVWPYLREIALPVVGFALGYALITVWFAGCFASVFYFGWGSFITVDPKDLDKHVHLTDASFVDFLYFSMTTISALGIAISGPPRRSRRSWLL